MQRVKSVNFNVMSLGIHSTCHYYPYIHPHQRNFFHRHHQLCILFYTNMKLYCPQSRIHVLCIVVGVFVFIVNIIFMLGRRVCIGRMNGSVYVIRNYLIQAGNDKKSTEEGNKKKKANK